MAAAKSATAKGASAPTEMVQDQVLRQMTNTFKLLSDPIRLKIVLMLDGRELYVGQLCEQLGQSQPAVSHHLALLRVGGIIWSRREGKNNFYSLTDSGQSIVSIARKLA